MLVFCFFAVVWTTSSAFTGGTVSGATDFTNGLTANTISATTYYNLPTYISATTLSAANVLSVASNGTSATTTTINAVTGGTYSSGTITLSGTGGVNGNTITGLNTGTVTSVSAGTGMTFTTITTSGSVSIDTAKVPYYSSTPSNGLLKYTSGTWGIDQNTYLTSAITSLGGLTGATQTFGNDTNVTMVSSGTTHTLTWSGTLADARIVSSTNWNTAYTNRITTLTVTGSSGSATLSSNILNIPTYTLAGLSGITLASLSFAAGSGGYNNTTGVITIPTNNSQLTNGANYITSFTGGTVSGETNFTGGVTANTLTVSAATHPVKFVGLQSTTTDTSILTVDGTGVVHTAPLFTWNNALTATTASTSNGYVGTATTLTTITLPTGATFGSVIEVVGTGTGLWRISQNANQFIKFGITGTTTGVGGYLSATSQYDCVKLLCTSANTAFVVTSAIGNIFYN